MNAKPRNAALNRVLSPVFPLALAAGLLWMGADAAPSVEGAQTERDGTWARLSVELPTSEARFPAGSGADVANAQCLLCHSAGMVLRQPPLTQDQWQGEIEKMRSSYGAPVPADQVEGLARYLQATVGRN
jgi:mono/diheme cytochrome c family protein